MCGGERDLAGTSVGSASASRWDCQEVLGCGFNEGTKKTDI
jgi:hypothetical protein